MATKKPGAGVLAPPEDDMEEGPAHEADPGDAAEDAGEGEREPAMPAGDGAETRADASPGDPKLQQLYELTMARVLEVLTAQKRELLAAMQGDPVAAAVKFGTEAVRQVSDAAERARGPLPWQVVIATGVQTVKYLAQIASDRGLLPDERIEAFLKEVFQRSVGEFASADAKAGKGQPPDGGAVASRETMPPGGAGVLSV